MVTTVLLLCWASWLSCISVNDVGLNKKKRILFNKYHFIIFQLKLLLSTSFIKLINYASQSRTVKGILNYFVIFSSDENDHVFRKNAAAIYENSPLYFGKGTGYIDRSLYGLRCNGDENSLHDCSLYPEESVSFHSHKFDVGVACSKWSERERDTQTWLY